MPADVISPHPLMTTHDQNEYEFKIYLISGVSLGRNEKMSMSQIIKNKMEYPNRELKEHHSCQRCNEDDGTINDKSARSALRDRVSRRSGRIIIEVRRGTRGDWYKWVTRAVRRRSVECASIQSNRVELRRGKRWAGSGRRIWIAFWRGKRWTGSGRRIWVAFWRACGGWSFISVSICVAIVIADGDSIALSVPASIE
jgi:hypothetical protein